MRRSIATVSMSGTLRDKLEAIAAARSDGYEIRRAAVARGVPCVTTLAGGMAAARAIAAERLGQPPVVSLQELHADGVVA
jgi:carbamoyl-phosphate synthase large subunit